jgi:hypothetical protein
MERTDRNGRGRPDHRKAKNTSATTRVAVATGPQRGGSGARTHATNSAAAARATTKRNMELADAQGL